MKSLTSIYIDFRSTELDCHCSLSWIKNPPAWIDVDGVKNNNQYCASPSNLKGLKWSNIYFEDFEVCPSQGLYIVCCIGYSLYHLHNNVLYL